MTQDVAAELIRQEETIKDYCFRLGIVYQDTVSRHHGYDYVLTKNGRQAIAEVKCRNISRFQNKDYMTSAHKVHGLMSYSKLFGVPALLIVRFIDDLGVWEIPCEDLMSHGVRFFIFARANERAEPCLQIPLSLFKFMGLQK